jgi:hypothetical protein
MYVVMTSRKTPGCYLRVAVVQITPEYAALNQLPKMISERAKGVVRVIDLGAYPATGKTPRSGLMSALARAEVMIRELNSVKGVI